MNLSNRSQCANAGQYFRNGTETSEPWSCKCLPCFKGASCETRYNYIQFSWTSLMSVDIQYSKSNNEKFILELIYFITTTLLFLTSNVRRSTHLTLDCGGQKSFSYVPMWEALN